MSVDGLELADGRYVIFPDRRLGGGHYGEVYEGLDRYLDRVVAIKLLAEDFEIDAVLLEAQLQRRVSEHPHIVEIFDVVPEPPRPFMVTALCRNGSVGGRLQRGAVPLIEAMRWTRGLLSGLGHAHSLGVIHRDVKPGNLLVTDNGTAALTDFGLAEDTLRNRIASDSVYVPHAAPELYDGSPSSAITDVFAAGCTAYRLLTGQRPFAPGDFVSAPTPAHRVNPQLPLAVSRAIDKALRTEPSERFANATEMHSALAGLKVEASWTDVSGNDGALASWEAHVPDGVYAIRLVRRPRAGLELTAHRDRGSGPRRVNLQRFDSEGRARQTMAVWLRSVVEQGTYPF